MTLNPDLPGPSLRHKLVRASAGLLAIVGLAILVLVGLIEYVVAQRGIDTLEKQINGTLSARGESLVSSQADVFRTLVQDNAVTEMVHTIALTVAGQDIIYGAYIDRQGKPWAYCSPAHPCSPANGSSEFLPVGTERLARDLALPLPLPQPTNDEVRELNLFDAEILEFTQPIRIDGQLSGSLRYGISTESLNVALKEARAERRSILTTALISIAALILIALLFGVWIAHRTAHRITKPLLALTEAAQRLAEGDHSAQVQISSKDELEVLGNTFNSMVDDLKRSYSELEEKNSELEREVNERRQAQAERTELQNHLVQSQKMEAFGQLAGGVAHDFNNILAIVIGNGELVEALMEEPGNHQELKRLIKEISDAADRGADLTRQLLTFARREADNPRMTDVNEVLTRFESLIRRVLEETVEVRIERATTLRKVYVDPGRLEQVMMNLCVNARDAMQGGGCLTLRTRDVRLRESSHMTSGPISPGRYTVIEAQDTGTGMPADVIERVFEPFFTTKPAGQGTGLGLATVHGIVSAAGGSLDIDSTLGLGSTFHIYLPVHEGLDQVMDDEVKPVPPQGNAEKILVCEDNDAVRMMTARILEKGGYKVVTTAAATEAVKLIPHGDFRLLITDVVMPEMDGGELVETAKILKEELPVLFVSGYTAGVLVSYGIRDDSLNFLRKPFRASALLERVQSLMKGEDDSPKGPSRSRD